MRHILRRTNHIRIVIAAGMAAFLLAPAARAQSIDTSWLRTRVLSNALNPNVSFIGDMTANTGPMADGQSNRFSFREGELGLQASVDPYARADFFIAFPEGEAVELEEGFVSLTVLPWNLRLRGGKFRANFGRLNMVHLHEQSQVDAPLALTAMLGAEGLNDTGAEVSRVFAPFGVFTELSYGLLNGLGVAEAAEPETATVTDTNGNTVTVTAQRSDPAVQRTIRNFAQIGRARVYGDLTDALNIECGLSGAFHEPKEQKETRMTGADFTFRWKPLQEGLYRSFILRAEGIYSDRKLMQRTSAVTGAVTRVPDRLHRRGGYAYAEFQPARRWRFGVRGDYSEAPETVDETLTLPDGTTRTVNRSITRTVSPYIAFTLSEFNRFRVQYQARQVPSGETEHRAFLQWTVVLGPHGAHAF